MENHQELEGTDSYPQSITYATNFGFANSDEFFQFLWFTQVLNTNDFQLCHNFYIYDPKDGTFKEIDFGIISRNLFMIIEHKHGLRLAQNEESRFSRMHHRTIRFFKDQDIVEIPNIIPVVITRDKNAKYKKGFKPVVINSKDNTQLFYTDFVRKEHATSYRKVSKETIPKILETLNCKPFEYRQIKLAIFDIFAKEFTPEKKTGGLSLKQKYELIGNIYNNFSPINYIFSDIFLSFEKERKGVGEKEKIDQIFCLHQMAPDDIIDNLYPIFWVCITRSQGDDYAKEFQLGFHISNTEWYEKGKVSTCERKHFTIKLAFFRRIKKESCLRKFKEKLRNNKTKFKNLLLNLNEDDDRVKFQFFRTIADRFDVELNPIDSENCDRFMDNILSYDRGETAIPRSTEIVKIFDWDDKLRRSLRTKSGAEKLLKAEYSKLVDLYKFMIDTD